MNAANIVLLTLALAWSTSSFCEGAPALDAPITKTWTIGISEEVPSMNFSFSDRKTDNNEVRYEANPNYNIRLLAAYGPYQISYAVAVPTEGSEVAVKGKTQHNDILFGYAWKAWAFDLHYRSYKGFYVESGSETEKIRPDISSIFYGAALYYSFSPEVYPLSILSDADWRANSSGHGFLGHATFNHFEFQGDHSVLSRNGLKEIDQFALNAGGGYGGYISGEQYLLAGNFVASLGPEQHKLSYAMPSTPLRHESGYGFTFGAAVDGKFAYRWEHFSLALGLKMNLISTYISDFGIQASGYTGSLTAYWRF